MIENTIKKLNMNTNLTYVETKQIFEEILTSKISAEQVNNLIMILGLRKESAAEIAGIVDAINGQVATNTNKKTTSKNSNIRHDYSNSLNF